MAREESNLPVEKKNWFQRLRTRFIINGLRSGRIASSKIPGAYRKDPEVLRELPNMPGVIENAPMDIVADALRLVPQKLHLLTEKKRFELYEKHPDLLESMIKNVPKDGIYGIEPNPLKPGSNTKVLLISPEAEFFRLMMDKPDYLAEHPEVIGTCIYNADKLGNLQSRLVDVLKKKPDIFPSVFTYDKNSVNPQEITKRDFLRNCLVSVARECPECMQYADGDSKLNMYRSNPELITKLDESLLLEEARRCRENREKDFVNHEMINHLHGMDYIDKFGIKGDIRKLPFETQKKLIEIDSDYAEYADPSVVEDWRKDNPLFNGLGVYTNYRQSDEEREAVQQKKDSLEHSAENMMEQAMQEKEGASLSEEEKEKLVQQVDARREALRVAMLDRTQKIVAPPLPFPENLEDLDQYLQRRQEVYADAMSKINNPTELAFLVSGYSIVPNGGSSTEVRAESGEKVDLAQIKDVKKLRGIFNDMCANGGKMDAQVKDDKDRHNIQER